MVLFENGIRLHLDKEIIQTFDKALCEPISFVFVFHCIWFGFVTSYCLHVFAIALSYPHMLMSYFVHYVSIEFSTTENMIISGQRCALSLRNATLDWKMTQGGVDTSESESS